MHPGDCLLLCSKIFSITLITGYRFMSKKALHPIEGGGVRPMLFHRGEKKGENWKEKRKWEGRIVK
jgi:hypothetical protein